MLWLAGVQFMHKHNVVHRDMTSNNLVLDRAVDGQHGGTVWIAKVRRQCVCV